MLNNNSFAQLENQFEDFDKNITIAEYIWLDGSGQTLRSKTRVK